MNSVLAITIIGILLIVTSIVLIAFVLMQSAKNSRMSGVVSGGGAETFFGKYKGKTIDKKLNRLTAIIAVIFAVVVILLYIAQLGTGKVEYEDPDWGMAQDNMTATTAGTTTKPATTTSPATTTDEPATTTGTPAGTTGATPDTTTAAPAEG